MTLVKRAFVVRLPSKFSYNNAEVGQGASRGASALTDGLRFQMNLSRPSEAQAKAFDLPKEMLNNYVAATVTKANYSAMPAPVLLERLSGGYLTAVTASEAKARAALQAMVGVMRVIESESRPISARSLEDNYSGVSGALKMSKDRVRDAIRYGIEHGHIEGGDRKPIKVTPLGKALLKSLPAPDAPKADATRGAKRLLRKKSL